MSSDESLEGAHPQPPSPRHDRAGSSKKKEEMEDIHEGFFEESSSSSEDDGIDFKAEPLEFSSTGSEDEKNSDVELKTSDEEQLLNLYDKKLRDKLTAKKSNKKESDEHEKMTSRIAGYMQKMRSDEKKMVNKMGDKPVDEERNRRNKEAVLKKFDYKDQLKHIKSQGFLSRYDSTDSGSGTDSDSEMDELTDKVRKMDVKKQHKNDKAKISKAATSRELDIRKKIAEMKKMVGSPKSPDHIDEHLIKAKQRVADWMKDEDVKVAAMKDKFGVGGKFTPESFIKELGKRPTKLSKPPEVKMDSRHPLPPVRTKKTLGAGDSIKNIKKEDVLQILRDAEPSKARKSVEKPPLPNTIKKNVTPSKLGPNFPTRLLQTKSESRNILGKTDLTPQLSVPSAIKVTEKKSTTLKKTTRKTGF